MAWFKRKGQGITTPTEEKKDIPNGMWHKTPAGHVINQDELQRNSFVSPEDGYHLNIGSKEYFELFFDNNEFEEIGKDVVSNDPLGFEDSKKYPDRIKATQEKTGLNDALRVGYGEVDGKELVIACFDFAFIGGSMGAVVGEKILRAANQSLESNCPLMIISKSGGARMQEGAFSLMQLAKTSGKLNELSEAGIPYISYITNPTYGGITASFAMLGDINIAETGAYIGFAGPRVIKETIGKDLPEGFQTAEFLQEKGFIDFIVDRRNAKEKISTYLELIAVQ